MSVSLASLEMTARELLEEELNRHKQPVAGKASEREGTFPAMWILSGLLKLVEETRDRPVQHLAPTIRSLVAEQSFAGDSGDNIIDAQRENQIELQVELVVNVLEKVRVMAQEQGLWSNYLAAPEMFG